MNIDYCLLKIKEIMSVQNKSGLTLFDKIWEKHIVQKIEDGPSVLYIDTHFIHEVTSPQALSLIHI